MFKVIKHLIDSMYMELDAAECYYYRALKIKDGHPQVAIMYNEIASQELIHCEKFHKLAEDLITKSKQNGTEISESVEAIWEYEHLKIIDCYEEIKYKISKLTF